MPYAFSRIAIFVSPYLAALFTRICGSVYLIASEFFCISVTKFVQPLRFLIPIRFFWLTLLAEPAWRMLGQRLPQRMYNKPRHLLLTASLSFESEMVLYCFCITKICPNNFRVAAYFLGSALPQLFAKI